MLDSLHGLVAVALGSAAGGAARYLVSGLVGRAVGESFPWGTMAVNVSGSFAGGTLVAAGAAGLLADPAQLLAVTGFSGSYTTVSSFSLQTLTLVREGQRGQAAGNVALSLALCLAAAALGLAAGEAILGLP
jgi:fluoride exporter